MIRRKRVWGVVLAGVLGLVGLGFLSWEVTPWVQRIFQDSLGRQGWVCTVGRAQWVPWSGLDLSDLRIQSPRGGRVHLVRAHVSPRISSLWEGGWVTEWDLGEIRIDPVSWRIRRPLAREILSAGPVTTGGFALLRWKPQELFLEQLTLQGPLLRFQADGWVRASRQVHGVLKGSVLRLVLEAMDLLAPQEGVSVWELFEMDLDGTWPAPALRFKSNFFTLSMNQPTERKP